MKFIITEDQKNLIDKYSGNTDEKVLSHLKRHFPIQVQEFEWFDKPFRTIFIDDKTRNLDTNKKYLVNTIFYLLEDIFPNVDKNILRRTIKYYIDVNRTLD